MMTTTSQKYHRDSDGSSQLFPRSLNDLNLPPNPFNVLATMAVANHTEDANDNNYSPQSPEPSEPSPILTPPMNVSALNSWDTSYTTTDDNTFYSSEEPWKIFFSHQAPHRRRHLRERSNENWRWKCPFQKRGECRSTSAKPAVRQSPQQRTFQVHQPRARTLKHSNSLMKLLNL